MITQKESAIYWQEEDKMTYSVHQTWDKLNVCAVGSAYPPEFYSFIKNTNVRSVMEKVSMETEEDYQALIALLQSHDVDIVRTKVQDNALIGDKLLPPPLSPRDHFGMIGEKFYTPEPARNRKWNYIHGPFYPKNPPQTQEDFEGLPKYIKKDLSERHFTNSLFDVYTFDYGALKPVVDLVAQQGNEILLNKNIDSAMCCRVGVDLYFGTWPGQDKNKLLERMQQEFPDYRCHAIETDGHLDGVFCPVKEGLILCNNNYVDKIDFATLFPGWEVAAVGKKSQKKEYEYLELKQKNAGRWWVPGEEYNDDFTDFVNAYMDFCVGNIEETVIGVNVLMVNENTLVCSEEDLVNFKILEKHGITPHIVSNRHHYFWDNGIHCMTTDLDRSGTLKDYFPSRRVL